MASRQYSTVSSYVLNLLREINKLSPEDIEAEYGIQVLPDQRVQDLINNITYNSLGEWAQSLAEQDDDYEETVPRGRGRAEYTR